MSKSSIAPSSHPEGASRSRKRAGTRGRKPTAEEIQAAGGKEVPDIIADNLDILFCGINPGRYSAAIGHHFSRPGNRFWKGIYYAGLTSRLLAGPEDELLLKWKIGITNLVARATSGERDLGVDEFRQGRRMLEKKVRRHHPRNVAILGIGAYKKAFSVDDVRIGKQEREFGGAVLWVFPNPSGLNAHYRVDDFARLFGRLRE